MSEEQTESKPEETIQLVVFGLASEEYAFDISKVREIVRVKEITRIPNAPSYVRGVINLRGKIIVVIDLGKKLGLESELTESARIIVLEIADRTAGVIVDSVSEVLRLNKEGIQEPPSEIADKINMKFLKGVCVLDERLLIMLEPDEILKEEELEDLKKIK
ncbi:MAG: chemotaxis protein CheW [Candidatus Hydrothermarchaeales archaeon]